MKFMNLQLENQNQGVMIILDSIFMLMWMDFQKRLFKVKTNQMI